MEYRQGSRSLGLEGYLYRLKISEKNYSFNKQFSQSFSVGPLKIVPKTADFSPFFLENLHLIQWM